ncbi:cutinase family protein [Candidatus Saccharibacteria bacterium]|nr:cutinase family protein [Candidatus Saccharibacteria bacterium]
MKSLFRLLPLFLIPLFFISSPVNSTGDNDCLDFEVIFARGSGQSEEDSDFRALKSALSEKIDIEYDISDLNYPAVSVANFSTALSTYLSAGESYEFKSSVEEGMKNLKSKIEAETKRCPNKKFILAGYSQGAMVISKSLLNLNPDKILYAGTFGDPKLYLPEGSRACQKIGLSNYRVYVPDCDVEEGVLTALIPYQQSSYLNKLGAFCNQNDFMCGSDLNLFNPLKAHLSYDSENGYKKFAEIIAEKISTEKAKKLTKSSKTTAFISETPPKDIVVLFDYSQFGTFSSDLKTYSISEDLKEKLVELTDKGARVALYNVYSVLSPNVEPLELVSDFSTTDLAKKIDDLNLKNQNYRRYNFDTSNNNIYYALSKISEGANWRTGAEKNIYLITNIIYPEYRKGFDGSTYREALEKMQENNVKFSVISRKGEESTYFNRLLIEGTNGVAIGNDFSKIKLSKNQSNYPLKSKLFSKTFNLTSTLNLIIVNDVVYGISREKSITVTGLLESQENSIIIVGFDETGKRLLKKTYTFSPENPKTPDCSSI